MVAISISPQLLRDVARLGRKTRSYLIYLAGALHIRLPVSAASHTLFPVCWRSSMLAWNKLDRISVKTTGLRCKCWLGTFFKKAGPVVGDVDRAQHQNNWFNTSHHHPLSVDRGCPIWGSGTVMGSLKGDASQKLQYEWPFKEKHALQTGDMICQAGKVYWKRLLGWMMGNVRVNVFLGFTQTKIQDISASAASVLIIVSWNA